MGLLIGLNMVGIKRTCSLLHLIIQISHRQAEPSGSEAVIRALAARRCESSFRKGMSQFYLLTHFSDVERKGRMRAMLRRWTEFVKQPLFPVIWPERGGWK